MQGLHLHDSEDVFFLVKQLLLMCTVKCRLINLEISVQIVLDHSADREQVVRAGSLDIESVGNSVNVAWIRFLV